MIKITSMNRNFGLEFMGSVQTWTHEYSIRHEIWNWEKQKNVDAPYPISIF